MADARKIIRARGTRLTLVLMIGFVCTIIISAATTAGWLDLIERRLSDLRARWFQFHTPPPTKDIVHLDITDRSLQVIGRWPWPRDVQAEILDVVNEGGAKVVMTDVIYAEPSAPGVDGRNPDDAMVEVLTRRGNVLIPYSATFTAEPEPTVLEQAIISLFEKDIEITPSEMVQQLNDRGFDEELAKVNLDPIFLQRREQTMMRRISALMDSGVTDVAELRARLLPRTDPRYTGSPLLRLLDEQLDRTLRFRELDRFSVPLQPAVPSLFQASNAVLPILRFSQAARYSGYVDYIPIGDAVVRSLPLFIEQNGKMVPAASFALACAFLNVPMETVRVTPNEVVLPLPEGIERRIPVRTVHSGSGRNAPLVMEVPWWGPEEEWSVMYDFPSYVQSSQHVGVDVAWSVIDVRRKMAQNQSELRKAVIYLTSVISPEMVEMVETLPDDALTTYANEKLGAAEAAIGEQALALAALDEQLAVVKACVAAGGLPPGRSEDDFYAHYEAMLKRVDQEAFASFNRALGLEANIAFAESHIPAAEQLRLKTDIALQTLRAATQIVPVIEVQNKKFAEELETARLKIRQAVNGKAVILGFVATGALDFYPTPLHKKSPGVVVHGAVFNGVVTGHVWTYAPMYITVLITLAMGFTATLVSSLLAPLKTVFVMVSLLLGYVLFNCMVLFDYGDTIVGLAGPIVVAGLVWSGTTLDRYVMEIQERARIKKRFQSYVDPQLVNYVVSHPEQDTLAGAVREMSVVFTDLEGFTTLSEKLKERTVGMLSEYMTLAVPIIRQNRGLVNKFLGDGIMFFYNAPEPNPDHAYSAAKTVFELNQMLVQFNEKLKQSGLPTLFMRAGLTTGEMVVGDAGDHNTGADYTVLGDNVNLSARLESANKVTGTKLLCIDRTVELLAGRFVVRPVAKLQVKGKEQSVMTWEPMCLIGQENEQIVKTAEHSKAVFEAYNQSQFTECLAAVEAMEKELGPSKFTKLYRDQARMRIEDPPGPEFDGRITLTEK